MELNEIPVWVLDRFWELWERVCEVAGCFFCHLDHGKSQKKSLCTCPPLWRVPKHPRLYITFISLRSTSPRHLRHLGPPQSSRVTQHDPTTITVSTTTRPSTPTHPAAAEREAKSILPRAISLQPAKTGRSSLLLFIGCCFACSLCKPTQPTM
jgi:hypothetical protein